MVRDGMANIVSRLRECGFDPRKVGQDAWESRCPGHRSLDHALSITRNEFNHVLLTCRSAENCAHRAKRTASDAPAAVSGTWERLRWNAASPGKCVHATTAMARFNLDCLIS